MNQIQWLYELANKRYLTQKQFDVLIKNKYVEDFRYFSDDINSTVYLVKVSEKGWDAGFHDLRFLINVIKDDYICKCGGCFEYIENQSYEEYSFLLKCYKCDEIMEKVKDERL